MTRICRPASLPAWYPRPDRGSAAAVRRAVLFVILASCFVVTAPGAGVSRAIEVASGPADSFDVPIGVELLTPLVVPDSIGPVAPQSLAMDGMGRLFILDRSQGRILRHDRDGQWLLFGSGDQGGRRYPSLTDLYAGWGPGLFALDPAASEIHQFDLDGHYRRPVGYPERREDRAQGFDLRAEDRALGFLQPADFALKRSGELLLLDESGGRLLLYDRNGRFVTDLAAGMAGTERPQVPARLALDRLDQIYVLDPPAGRVRPFSRQGAASASWVYREGLAWRGSRGTLFSVAVDRVVIASGDGRWVRLFSPEGEMLLHWDNPSPPESELTDMAASGDTLLYLASPATGEVLRWRWVQAPDSISGVGDGREPGVY